MLLITYKSGWCYTLAMQPQEQAPEEAYCPNVRCPNTDKMNAGSSCTICGSKASKMSYVDFTRIMGEKQKLIMLREKIRKGETVLLIRDEDSDEKIRSDIKRGLLDMALVEVDSSIFSKSVSYLSKNMTDQLLGVGLRMLIEQNKVIIRQNELLLRELNKIARLLEEASSK